MTDETTHVYKSNYSLELVLTEAQIKNYTCMTEELVKTYPVVMGKNPDAVVFSLNRKTQSIEQFEKICGEQTGGYGALVFFQSNNPTEPGIIALPGNTLLELVRAEQVFENVSLSKGRPKDPKKFGQTKFLDLREAIREDAEWQGGKSILEKGINFKVSML